MFVLGLLLTAISLLLAIYSFIQINHSKNKIKEKISLHSVKDKAKVRRCKFLWKRLRDKKVDEQVAQTIELFSISLKAGISFIQIVERVVMETKPPVSAEFKIMLKEMYMGMPFSIALKGLGDRIDNQSMDLFITAILINLQLGGNLAEVLDKISGTIRERLNMKREIEIKTAQGRISGIILMVLPFFLMLAITVVNPGYLIILITEPVGLIILGIALLLQLIGIYFTRKIIQIDI